MLTALSIEKMTENDLDEVYTLSRESNLAYWSRLDYQLELLRRDAVCLTAKNQTHTLAGFVVMRLIRQECYSEIYNIAVTAKYRQCGVAGKLLEECIKISRHNQLERIFLEVRKSNRAAVRLYLKHSFVEIGKRRNFYSNPQEDAVSMSRVLTEV